MEDLVSRVLALETALADLDDVIQALAARAAETVYVTDSAPESAAEAAEDGEEAKAGVDLRALDLWVRDWLLPTFRRDAGSLSQRWCAQWWGHAEAVVRLEAMRTAFIAMTADGGAGSAAWLREVADVQLARLFDDRGPFGDCRTEPAAKHSELPPLPAVPIPGGLLDEIDAGAPATAICAT